MCFLGLPVHFTSNTQTPSYEGNQQKLRKKSEDTKALVLSGHLLGAAQRPNVWLPLLR